MAKISSARKNRIRKENARNTGGTKKFSTKNLKKAILRQLPLLDEEDVGYQVGLHFIGQGGPKVCPNVTLGESCPVCKAKWAVNDILDDLDEDNAKDRKKIKEFKEIASKLRVTVRYAMKIVDREDPENVQIIEMPKDPYETIFDCYNDDEDDLSHPEEGCDFRLSKKGVKWNEITYSAKVLTSSPLADDEEVIAKLTEEAQSIDLAEMYKPDAQLLADLVESIVDEEILAEAGIDTSGSDDDIDDDDEDDDIDDDEDDDIEDDEDDEEDEEDEEDDEEEDDEDDEEEDDEDDDEEDDEEDDELDEEDDELDEDDFEDVDDNEEEEEEPPAAAKARSRKAVKGKIDVSVSGTTSKRAASRKKPAPKTAKKPAPKTAKKPAPKTAKKPARKTPTPKAKRTIRRKK